VRALEDRLSSLLDPGDSLHPRRHNSLEADKDNVAKNKRVRTKVHKAEAGGL
jgi:hypothetical protein